MGVVITSPNRTLWPDSGDDRPVSKLDLARYFESVADEMMPHLQGRPCSIIRTPDGITGERFFQRHPGRGLPDAVTAVTLSGDDEPYLQIDRKAALAALAQLSATELHPWNCRPRRPEVPGRLVFDLDPDAGLPFDCVVAAAKDVRARLEALGLVAFCRTTGGKGLHVVTPLADETGGGPDWPAAKAFAREICARMAADSPELYTIKISKASRKGRMFLDYLRNDRMSTAIAPLSPRARPGAPVAMPLTWSQVRAGLDPMRFTLRTVPRLLRKTTAWAGYDAAERPLSEAIARLAARTS